MNEIGMLDRRSETLERAAETADLLQKAVDAHRRGAPDEAERLYRPCCIDGRKTATGHLRSRGS
jgi:hypothetical protein